IKSALVFPEVTEEELSARDAMKARAKANSLLPRDGKWPGGVDSSGRPLLNEQNWPGGIDRSTLAEKVEFFMTCIEEDYEFAESNLLSAMMNAKRDNPVCPEGVNVPVTAGNLAHAFLPDRLPRCNGSEVTSFAIAFRCFGNNPQAEMMID